MHDLSLNRTCGVLVSQPNVTLVLTGMTKVSPDEGRTDARLTLDDVTLQSQSRQVVTSSANLLINKTYIR